MAAADYYGVPSPRPMGHTPPVLTPPQQPIRTSSHSAFTYGQPGPSPQLTPQYPLQAPPPYAHIEEAKPSVHFAPTASALQQRHSFSGGQRPYPHGLNGSSPLGPTSNPGSNQNGLLQPGPYQPQRLPYQPQSHHASHGRPYHHKYDNSTSSLESGYASDPEPHRRKQKSRPRRISDSSRSTNADGLIGAGAGGLIGDMIFPGLGTVGGALAGWIGGKDYGKHRKWREDKREREQDRWEEKFGRHEHSHTHDHRKNNHNRRRSYD